MRGAGGSFSLGKICARADVEEKGVHPESSLLRRPSTSDGDKKSAGKPLEVLRRGSWVGGLEYSFSVRPNFTFTGNVPSVPRLGCYPGGLVYCRQKGAGPPPSVDGASYACFFRRRRPWKGTHGKKLCNLNALRGQLTHSPVRKYDACVVVLTPPPPARNPHFVARQVSQMYETTLSALKEEGNERMWFNTYVKLAKVSGRE